MPPAYRRSRSAGDAPQGLDLYRYVARPPIDMKERLQKILARSGYGSRRACEELIAQGRVTVNGQIATLGTKVDLLQDNIAVDEKPIRVSEGLKYIALNKPRNVISAASSQDKRKAVRDLVDEPGRLYPHGIGPLFIQ